MIITFISDTHTKHRMLNLPGGDLLIFAGDLMSSGYSMYEVANFCEWFNKQKYDYKIFIAGNHDRLFENDLSKVMDVVNNHYDIKYLQDETYTIDYNDQKINIYGSPWQPEFLNWAFNIPRNCMKLKEKRTEIPKETDILITHGPPEGILDTSGPPYNEPLLGCKFLKERVNKIKPKINVFGHIHGGYGYFFDGNTHFINASILNERYEYRNKPITANWDPHTNEIEFL